MAENKELASTKKCEKTDDPKKESSRTVEQETFQLVQKQIQPSLELVINRVAVKLWSKEVIPEETFEKIFDVARNGAAWRSVYFMNCFRKRVKNAEKEEPSHKRAKQMIADLVAILRNDSALEYVADLVANCSGSNDLKKATDDIAASLDSSLTQIAPSMYSKSYIGDVEYNVIMDPSAQHATAATNAVLFAVSKAIEVDPNHLETFKRVLLDMDKPISELAVLIAETEFNVKDAERKKK